jgi:hypothetical protein
MPRAPKGGDLIPTAAATGTEPAVDSPPGDFHEINAWHGRVGDWDKLNLFWKNLYRFAAQHNINVKWLGGLTADDFQPLCDLLTAICALSSGQVGYMARIADAAVALRSMVVDPGSTAYMSIADGAGTAGDTIFSLNAAAILAGVDVWTEEVISTAAFDTGSFAPIALTAGTSYLLFIRVVSHNAADLQTLPATGTYSIDANQSLASTLEENVAVPGSYSLSVGAGNAAVTVQNVLLASDNTCWKLRWLLVPQGAC